MTPSQYRRATELVEMIHQNFLGVHCYISSDKRHIYARRQILNDSAFHNFLLKGFIVVLSFNSLTTFIG
jgi:hypothetical protein